MKDLLYVLLHSIAAVQVCDATKASCVFQRLVQHH